MGKTLFTGSAPCGLLSKHPGPPVQGWHHPEDLGPSTSVIKQDNRHTYTYAHTHANLREALFQLRFCLSKYV